MQLCNMLLARALLFWLAVAALLARVPAASGGACAAPTTPREFVDALLHDEGVTEIAVDRVRGRFWEARVARSLRSTPWVRVWLRPAGLEPSGLGTSAVCSDSPGIQPLHAAGARSCGGAQGGRARVRVRFSTWLPSLAGRSRPHVQRDLLIYSAASSGRPTLDLAYLTGLVKLAPGRTFTIQGVRARRMEAGIPMGLFVYSPGATVVLDDVADSADVSVALAPFAVASHPPSCHPDTPVLSCLHLCAHRCVRRRALPRSSSPALCRGPSPAPTRAPFPPAAPTK